MSPGSFEYDCCIFLLQCLGMAALNYQTLRAIVYKQNLAPPLCILESFISEFMIPMSRND